MEYLTVILFCTWKFAFTFPVAVCVMKMSFIETLIFTNSGGILGVVFFSFLSKIIIDLWNKYWPNKFKIRRSEKKKFTKRNRRLVTIKTKYGMPGIVILTPILLSIPIGSFLVTRYYGHKALNYLWLIVGLFGWSVIYTLFYKYILYLFI